MPLKCLDQFFHEGPHLHPYGIAGLGGRQVNWRSSISAHSRLRHLRCTPAYIGLPKRVLEISTPSLEACLQPNLETKTMCLVHNRKYLASTCKAGRGASGNVNRQYLRSRRIRYIHGGSNYSGVVLMRSCKRSIDMATTAKSTAYPLTFIFRKRNTSNAGP